MGHFSINMNRKVKCRLLLFVILAVVGVSYLPNDQQLMRIQFVCMTIAFLFVCFYVYRIRQAVSRARAEADTHFVQTEALLSLMAIIRPSAPLPPTRSWAASPDFLCEVASRILQDKPKLVVEASSGVSTVVIAYCLRMNGEGGRVISLEHDEHYASVTRKQLKIHDLEEFSTVAYSPLIAHDLDGKQYRWYEASAIPESAEIDLLVVDGPPAKSDCDVETRFPALPLLISRLSIGSTVIMDDVIRQGEKQIVQEWLRRFPNFHHEYLCLEKGASVLVKKESVSPSLSK